MWNDFVEALAKEGAFSPVNDWVLSLWTVTTSADRLRASISRADELILSDMGGTL